MNYIFDEFLKSIQKVVYLPYTFKLIFSENDDEYDFCNYFLNDVDNEKVITYFDIIINLNQIEKLK